MIPHTWRLVLLAVFTLAVGALLLARQTALRQLRHGAERSRGTAATLAELQQANARLEATRLSDKELAALRADHATLAGMRNEIAAIERSIEARERAASSTTRPVREEAPTLLEAELTSYQWRDAGRATPAATVETMLWAATGGNADKLAETLALSPPAREKAEALFAALPADLRRDYGTAERLVGVLTAKDISGRAAEVLAEAPYADGTSLVLNLLNNDGQSRRIQLTLRPDGDSWRIEVPPAAIDRLVAAARSDGRSLQVPAMKVN